MGSIALRTAQPAAQTPSLEREEEIAKEHLGATATSPDKTCRENPTASYVTFRLQQGSRTIYPLDNFIPRLSLPPVD